MRKTSITAVNAPAVTSGYVQAVEVVDAPRLLFVSGQIPVGQDGQVPPDFPAQARLAWSNVAAQLEAAEMTLDNLVKVTIFLSDRAYAADNRMVRQEVMGARQIALTVIITGIFDTAWLLEIEAIAAA